MEECGQSGRQFPLAQISTFIGREGAQINFDYESYRAAPTFSSEPEPAPDCAIGGPGEEAALCRPTSNGSNSKLPTY